ncbi:MAG: lipopolysaccharide heptosyltransferase II [Calditrichaeota bacterium]|nr:lipopolysaccharide heptosyltransferase II [Calditrichota bacterium]RQV99094.1 MAG: lipopolysaccharide heptosyltransferase II [Calditrichota bacterium]
MNQTPDSFKKILILQTAFIGDVILTTPLLRVCAEKFPTAQIHFITIPASRNTVETLPYIYKLWIYDKRGKDAGLANLIRFSRKLKKEKFDLALIPHRSLRSALLVYFARISRRIGFDTSSGSFLFSDKVKYSGEGHEINRNLKLFEPLNIEINEKQFPEIHPDETDRKIISDWLQQNGLGTLKPLVCMAPGSIWFTKRWIPEYWATLSERLTQQGYSVVFVGSSVDHPLIQNIIEMINSPVYNASGLFTVRQSAELIRRSILLISNDSAPTHIGVSVKTPVLTIFGSTVPTFGFYPCGENDRVAEIENLPCRPCTDHGREKCPLKHFKCMKDLYPDHVFEIAEEMIHEHH